MADEKPKISRIDSRNKVGTTRGWFVREYYKGLIISCLFSDQKYEGKENAQAKATQLAKDLSEHKALAIRKNQDLYDWYGEAEKIKERAKAQ